jgi:hypothetical protein
MHLADHIKYETVEIFPEESDMELLADKIEAIR